MTTPMQNGNENGFTIRGGLWSNNSGSEFEGSSESGSSESSSGYDSVASKELHLYDSRVAKCVC